MDEHIRSPNRGLAARVDPRECEGGQASGPGLASCSRSLPALALRRDEADRPLGRIGRSHQFTQCVENLLELAARVAAEGVVHGPGGHPNSPTDCPVRVVRMPATLFAEDVFRQFSGAAGPQMPEFAGKPGPRSGRRETFQRTERVRKAVGGPAHRRTGPLQPR